MALQEGPSQVQRAAETITTTGADADARAHAGNHPPRLVLRCFPATDRGFVADVHGLVGSSWETAIDPEDLLDRVGRELALKYPFATIQPRDPLAELGTEQWQTWYVYRDGRAT